MILGTSGFASLLIYFTLPRCKWIPVLLEKFPATELYLALGLVRTTCYKTSWKSELRVGKWLGLGWRSVFSFLLIKIRKGQTKICGNQSWDWHFSLESVWIGRKDWDIWKRELIQFWFISFKNTYKRNVIPIWYLVFGINITFIFKIILTQKAIFNSWSKTNLNHNFFQSIVKCLSIYGQVYTKKYCETLIQSYRRPQIKPT